MISTISCSKGVNSPIQLKIGDKYQGGTIVYILGAGDTGYEEGVQHGIIASPDNLGLTYWCPNVCLNLMNGADGIKVGDGKQNTIDILTSCDDAGTAAKLCDAFTITENGKTYDDWYLPSKKELEKVYEQKDLIGNYKKTEYWSSTEESLGGAWVQDFSDNTQKSQVKTYQRYVRAIRSF